MSFVNENGAHSHHQRISRASTTTTWLSSSSSLIRFATHPSTTSPRHASAMIIYLRAEPEKYSPPVFAFCAPLKGLEAHCWQRYNIGSDKKVFFPPSLHRSRTVLAEMFIKYDCGAKSSIAVMKPSASPSNILLQLPLDHHLIHMCSEMLHTTTDKSLSSRH